MKGYTIQIKLYDRTGRKATHREIELPSSVSELGAKAIVNRASRLISKDGKAYELGTRNFDAVVDYAYELECERHPDILTAERKRYGEASTGIQEPAAD